MSGTNQFQPFAVGGGANTLTPTAWAALTALLSNGFASGTASSQQINTALRQATFMAAGLGQFAANLGINANDDSTLANIAATIANAVALGKYNALTQYAATQTLPSSVAGGVEHHQRGRGVPWF